MNKQNDLLLKRKNNIREKKEIERDPYVILGFGMISYRIMLKSLIWLFMALTVLGIFQMSIYATGEAYSFKDTHKMRFSEYTFGNLGYDSIKCNVAPIMQGRLYMHCSYGNI